MDLMKRELLNYDIFPKVIPVGKEVSITVKPRGGHAAFDQKKEYTVAIHTTTEGNPTTYPNRNNYAAYQMSPSEDGCFHIVHTFKKESEYYIRIILEDKRLVQLSVYAVADDLVGRYPYIGDMHMHSTRSDGKEHPFIVAANYRRAGYDFMAITDHRKYYPSLETRNFYAPLHLDVKFYPGEEIHLPGNDIHIVNFGGDYSVNGLLDCSQQYLSKGADPKWRSLTGICPDVMTEEQYRDEVNALAETLDIPENVEKFSYASCVWICNHIKKANGLGIFAHPYWISNVYQVPEDFTDYMFETHPFDAFEVFGGLTYFQQNGYQVQKYHDYRAKGIQVPIVGNTDTHGSTPYNADWHSARSMVLAYENTRDEIVGAVKSFYNVAIQDIKNHVEVLGTLRMMKYCWFLYEHYLPIHDELCFEEGRLMKEYACGDEEAGEDLRRISGRMDQLRKKYFCFG
jgi:hypothetical protein